MKPSELSIQTSQCRITAVSRGDQTTRDGRHFPDSKCPTSSANGCLFDAGRSSDRNDVLIESSFQSQMPILIQKQHPYTGDLNSEPLGTVKTHLYILDAT